MLLKELVECGYLSHTLLELVMLGLQLLPEAALGGLLPFNT